MEGIYYELTPESWVTYYNEIPFDMKMSSEQFEELWNLHPKDHDSIMMFGKLIPVKRYNQSYGLPYKFAGIDHPALPFPPIVKRYIDYLNENGFYFNSALVNWYSDGEDYIGFHSDDTRQLVKDSPIACFSFGETKKFQLKSIADNKITNNIMLNNNSLIIMGGLCQKTHKHSIAKGKSILGRRISITLRQFK
jgi:alkylated DNA repair dioxygenase AlkB